MRNGLTLWRNRNPFSELGSLRRDVDRLFGEADWGPLAPATSAAVEWAPRATITEDDKAYFVKADLPGVQKEDIKVDFNSSALTISGERREEKKTDNERAHISEVFYGSFSRTFTFPEGVDAEKISAKFDHGVLTVELAKKASSTARQIAVK